MDETDRATAVRMIDELSKMDGVAHAWYLSKDEAMAEYKMKWGDKAYLLDGFAENPLPNSIRVKLSDLEKSDAVVEKARTFQGIEDIKYYKTAVDKLLKIRVISEWTGQHPIAGSRIGGSGCQHHQAYGIGQSQRNQHNEIRRSKQLVYPWTVFGGRHTDRFYFGSSFGGIDCPGLSQDHGAFRNGHVPDVFRQNGSGIFLG